MDSEIKQKWIAALRSGQYKQGKNRLRCEDSFCCLGVLCDLIDNRKWKNRSASAEYPMFAYEDGNAFYPAMPPPKLKMVVGLENDQALHLADLNDTGKSFAEIADYIEKNL